jgi:phosphoribosyl 1,2-cyclic phosphodiesterase
MLLWEHRRVRFFPWPFQQQDPEVRRQLERAVAEVDRELAANLELMSLFDQTHQAIVLENGEFTRHHATIEVGLDDAYRALADLYSRIPDTESAMERRGPANSIREADRLLIETWEGDARAAQRGLREALAAPRPSPFARLLRRVRGVLPSRR